MTWRDLETPLEPEPAFYIQPTDRENRTELERVISFRKAIRERMPQARVVAVPNGGKRGQKAVNIARAEGAVWGWPDLLVLAPGRVAFLEFKNGKRAPASHQVEQMNWLVAAGFDVACVRSAEGALQCLEKWGWFNGTTDN